MKDPAMPDSNNHSWIPALAEFLLSRSDVEAVLLDPKNKTISLATQGTASDAELQACLTQTTAAIESSFNQSQPKLPQGTQLKDLAGKALLQKQSPLTAPKFWKWREFSWPQPEKENPTCHSCHDHHHDEDWRLLLALSAACGIFGILGFIFQFANIGPPWTAAIFYIIAMICGGWDALHDVRHKLPKGELDIHFLMLAVAVGASAIGAWREGALLLFLFALSGALEHFAKDRTRRAIDSLFKTAPKTATLYHNTHAEEEIPIELVTPGQILIVKPGQLFPVDGEIIHGETAADESNLTGESHPINKNIGDQAYSGTLNLWGVVRIKVLKPASESSLQRIIRLIQDAQHLRAPSQRFTDKFGTPYTYLVLSLVTIMFFVWWLLFDISPFINTPDSYSAFYRAMTLLVVASPCALVLSIPSAILAAIAWGASHGVLFRGGAAIEKLADIDVVALDKTGTLTTGDLQVNAVESFPPGKETKVLELAYSLEKNATHPIARAIVAYCKSQGVEHDEVAEFKSLTGSGVQAKFKDATCVLGRRALLEMGPLADWVKNLPETDEENTEVWVVYKDLIGRILLRDHIREESKPVLEKLKSLGIKTLMLTGDRREAAQSVGQALGLQEVRYALKPDDKVQIIKDLTKSGHKVAMVGDGVNDAPSLAAAYVPVAMGARGSDAALEQSEVVLMNDRIDYFLDAYELSVRAKKIIRINLAISLAAIFIMLGAGMFGIVPLTLGVVTHEGSTIFVCLNSLRLLSKRLF